MANIFSRIDEQAIGAQFLTGTPLEIALRDSIHVLPSTFKNNARRVEFSPSLQARDISREAWTRKNQYETGDADQRRPAGRMPDRDC
jgi:hypothetical protein